MKWDFSDVVQKINYKILYKHHLRSIKQVFSNLYELILELYPNRNIKPYYFKKYRNAWKNEDNSLNHDLIKQAVRELITILSIKKKNYKINNIPKWISYNHFQKKILPYGANLSYLLSSIFNNSPIKAIMFTFPEMNLKPHYFKNVPKGFWKGNKGKNNAKIIMNEVYLTLTNKEGPYKFSKKEFVEIMKYKTYHKSILPYGKKLGGMLQSLFNNSPTKPLELIEDPDICNMFCDSCVDINHCVHRKQSFVSINN